MLAPAKEQPHPQPNYSESDVKIVSPSAVLSELQASMNTHQKLALMHQIESLKQAHTRQIQSLKLSQHLQQSTHSFTLQQMQIKYDQVVHQRDCLSTQNMQLKQQVQKLKEQLTRNRNLVQKYEEKIRNQEELIDQYKRSIEEQISLEKEVIRVQYMERELAKKLQFQKALQSMENNYHRKMQEHIYHTTQHDYRQEVRKLCSTLKKRDDALKDGENVEIQRKRWKQENRSRKSSEASTMQMKSSSSYSTIER